MSADVESWTLVNYLEEGGFPALLWDTLKDFGYTTYPEYSAREVLTTGQLLRCEVKVQILVSPINPSWEEWECMAHGRNLADTVQKAALEALTTFCGKHPIEIVNSAARVIPVPERHIALGGERETILLAQSNSHYSPDLVTSVCFSEAMYDTYRRMVGESVFYRHQIYRYKVKEVECTAQTLKEARAMIATLKKERRKDKAKIQELTEIIHEQNFLLQHNDQYMLELESQLEALAVPPQNLTFLDPPKKKMLKISKVNLELSLDQIHRRLSVWKTPPWKLVRWK
jgi:hypothetical protein